MTGGPTARTAAALAHVGGALFWVGLVVGGLLEPGYSPLDDYISALASRGSSVAPIGIAAIAALALAYIATGIAPRAAWRAYTLAALLVLAGLAGLLVAGAPHELCERGGRLRGHDQLGKGLGRHDARVGHRLLRRVRRPRDGGCCARPGR